VTRGTVHVWTVALDADPGGVPALLKVRLPPSERPATFFSTWTRKEASSAFHREKRSGSIRSSGCCSRRRGKGSKTRGSCPRRCWQRDRRVRGHVDQRVRVPAVRNRAAIDFYMTTGSGRYAASGRLSCHYGFQGPSLTLDTGCSSSLVAVHLACQSLWSGESELAFAGAANTIVEPSMYALPPLGLDGGEVPPTIELMAATQREIIRRIQPAGPCYLGGFCFAAAVAFEVARQLRDEGERVELVVARSGSALTG
jgi:Beta-ketoacyl synthase, N-terminal domain/Thioesterase domain